MNRRHPTTYWAALLDALAASLRSGRTLNAAWTECSRHWGHGVPPTIETIGVPRLDRRHPDPEFIVLVRAVQAAREFGGNGAAALQSGASLIRSRRAAHAEVMLHSAHTRTSARLLTAVPLVVFTLGLCTNAGFRHSVLSGRGIVLAIAGVSCNALGWLLIRRAVHRVGRRHLTAAAFNDAVELVVLAIRAGELPATAVGWVARHGPPEVRPAFTKVVAVQASGARFADAVAVLPSLLGPMAVHFTDALVTAELDGLPLAPVLDRITADARATRTRQLDSEARSLGVRLAVPLTLCTLPSFTLLAIAPMVLAALDQLHR